MAWLDKNIKMCDIHGINNILKKYSFERSTKDDINSIGVHIPDVLGPWPRLDRKPYTHLSQAASSAQVEFSFAGDISRGIIHLMKFCRGMLLTFLQTKALRD